ncbi:hypothetical protein [Psychrobium sp. 1_MG-2023]|uniref:hypothetical protein n=1 Tax=Psychrobium sp. 1_MG-2023 TaxID=3062624 RepID=UPI00129161B5|nr:hypothetical protein [Psychrobium sp. 1_MG-2023]MDP2561105.1 hypothetical protein [Psychrobium sp. 1_MG-2023]
MKPSFLRYLSSVLLHSMATRILQITWVHDCLVLAAVTNEIERDVDSNKLVIDVFVVGQEERAIG